MVNPMSFITAKVATRDTGIVIIGITTARQFCRKSRITSITRHLADATELGDIILRAGSDGSMLRLSDVARVELGSESYSMVSDVSGSEAGLIGVSQVPGANALEVAKAVENRLEHSPGWSHTRMLYSPAPKACTLPTPSIRESASTIFSWA